MFFLRISKIFDACAYHLKHFNFILLFTHMLYKPRTLIFETENNNRVMKLTGNGRKNYLRSI